jgi:hypothetical protein
MLGISIRKFSPKPPPYWRQFLRSTVPFQKNAKKLNIYFLFEQHPLTPPTRQVIIQILGARQMESKKEYTLG